jgi:alkanesulfonate monooxygenase
MRKLEFGWFLPTAGDTTAYGLASAQVPPSLDLFDKVTAAAEAAGFEYMLVPVQTACWEAWISSAMMVARSKSIRMLVAARPSYINPVLLAKMIAAFDQLSGGRICINLIAGQSEAENASEGIKWAKEERYEIMDEEVTLLKLLWTSRRSPTTASSTSSTRRRSGRIPCRSPSAILSRRRQPAGLGDLGQALRRASVLGRHLSAHPGEHGGDPRHGGQARPRGQIGFGMRLQIVCRETEQEAWEFAHDLVGTPARRRRRSCASASPPRRPTAGVRELAADGEVIERNLFTGITKVRPGAGIAVVGTPEQCAETLQDYIDLGCHSFCLSGYLHDEEASASASG